jgi:tetratricopeptide (TPR) repeat protein
VAAFYEGTNNFEYASILYIQCAELLQPPNCHSVILLNNIGTCQSQRVLPKLEPIDRSTQLEAAKSWLVKALQLAQHIKLPERTPECDIGCVVSLHNIGEIEEQLGRVDEAKARYKEAESRAQAAGLQSAAENAKAGLKRLEVAQAMARSS